MDTIAGYKLYPKFNRPTVDVQTSMQGPHIDQKLLIAMRSALLPHRDYHNSTHGTLCNDLCRSQQNVEQVLLTI